MRPDAALTLVLALAFAAPRAHAQTTAEVKRGEVKAIVKVNGTVVAEDVFRLKSTIAGRIEAVLASTRTWAGPEAPLGLLANTELAAMVDARQTTPTQVLEERWQKIYQPVQIKCRSDCFVLRVFARPKRWVQPQAVLFEAAEILRLVGRVRPEDRHWIKDGQVVEFWPASDKGYTQTAVIDRFVLDVQGQRVEPGGTFHARLDRKRYLDPGTQWEGRIIAKVKKDALYVPTAALIQWKGETYLPVRVSTGITTWDITEIQAGTDGGRPVLILDPADLKGAEPHFPAVQPIPAKPLSIDEEAPKGRRALDDSTYDKPQGDFDE